MAAFGNFVWMDLMTPDPERDFGFYAEIMGWRIQHATMEGQDYAMFSVGETSIGGVMALAPEMKAQGVPPHWLSYILVPSVDQKTKRAQELGGRVIVPPTDIPGIGRFSILADPQGAAFAMFEGQGATQMPVPTGPGFPAWFELTTSDHQAAKAFYREIAGFTHNETNDMGEMGTYETFKSSDPQSPPIVGMWTAPRDRPIPPNWLPYFEVADLDGTLERVRALGGTVLNGPMDVPDGTRVAQCIDPKGAAFGLNQR